MADTGEMAREMERVCRALEAAGLHLAAQDRADSARQLADRVVYSPLRTLLDHGQQSAERVLAHLRGSHDPPAQASRREHLPQRPSWICDTCDADWPCAAAKLRLADELGRVQLTVYMMAQLDVATTEAKASVEELYQRFIPWIHAATAPDGAR